MYGNSEIKVLENTKFLGERSNNWPNDLLGECIQDLIYILSHPPPIICNNNIMDMACPSQMRQSDKCESVKNDEIFNFFLLVFHFELLLKF